MVRRPVPDDGCPLPSFLSGWAVSALPDALLRLAEAAGVLCGKYLSTLRQVLAYSPQSTIRRSAGRPCVFRRGMTGCGGDVSSQRGALSVFPGRSVRIFRFFAYRASGFCLQGFKYPVPPLPLSRSPVPSLPVSALPRRSKASQGPASRCPVPCLPAVVRGRFPFA